MPGEDAAAESSEDSEAVGSDDQGAYGPANSADVAVAGGQGAPPVQGQEAHNDAQSPGGAAQAADELADDYTDEDVDEGGDQSGGRATPAAALPGAEAANRETDAAEEVALRAGMSNGHSGSPASAFCAAAELCRSCGKARHLEPPQHRWRGNHCGETTRATTQKPTAPCIGGCC